MPTEQLKLGTEDALLRQATGLAAMHAFYALRCVAHSALFPGFSEGLGHLPPLEPRARRCPALPVQKRDP